MSVYHGSRHSVHAASDATSTRRSAPMDTTTMPATYQPVNGVSPAKIQISHSSTTTIASPLNFQDRPPPLTDGMHTESLRAEPKLDAGVVATNTALLFSTFQVLARQHSLENQIISQNMGAKSPEIYLTGPHRIVKNGDGTTIGAFLEGTPFFQLIETALLFHDPTIHGLSLTAPKIGSVTNPSATTPASPTSTTSTLTSEIVSSRKRKVANKSCIAIPAVGRTGLLVNPPIAVTWSSKGIHQSKKFASVFDEDINSDDAIPGPVVNGDNAIDQLSRMLRALTLQYAEEPEGAAQRAESVNTAPSVLVSAHTTAGGIEAGVGTSPEAADAERGDETPRIAGAVAALGATKSKTRGKRESNKTAAIDEVDAENDISAQPQAEVDGVDPNNDMSTQTQAKVNIVNMTVHVPATDDDDDSNDEMPALTVEDNNAIHELVELVKVLTLQDAEVPLSC
ncbi:hypothetical protein FRB94_013429 [Tulasnella sp. JGI-2019a]|nr:hypothetical protein FRB94_013429 [Tulasnella sp. JGI-2019a]